MDLLDMIPFGHDNAVTREELKRRTGLPDRVMRAKITALREEVPIINLQDGCGYFRPLPHEFCLVRLWMAQTRSRARECSLSMQGASKWLINQLHQPMDGQMRWDDA